MKRTSLFLTVMLALTGLVAATGSAHADELVQMTGPDAAVPVGTEFTYTATGALPFNSYGILLTLTGAAATITSVSSNGANNCSFFGMNQVICSQDGPPPTAGFKLVMTATVLPTEAGIVTAIARVGSGSTSFGGASKDTTIAEPADLDVTLNASSSILLTSRVVYTAHAFNNGPATSPGSTVTTHLSSPAVSVNAGSGCSLSSGNQDVICPVGSLASGSGMDVTFTVTFPLLTIGLPLNATATIAGTSTTDPTPGNNTDGAACLAVSPVLIVCP